MSFIAKRLTPSANADVFTVALDPHFAFGAQEYQSLHQRSQASAFQAPQWLEILHRELAPALGAEPVTLAVRDGVTQRLTLVLPLMRLRRRGVSFLEFADLGLCDYLGPVYDPADTRALIEDPTLPERLVALLPKCDVILLQKLAARDPVIERMFPHARQACMRISAYPARIEGSWTDWRAAKLDASFKKHLDARRRRLGKTGPNSFSLVQDENEITRLFEALRAFRAERFKDIGAQDVMSGEAIFAFYRRNAVEGAQLGTARTFGLYLDDEPVAVLFGLVDRGTFSFLLLGFDVRRYGRNSPGLLATEDSLGASFEAGDRVFDFTIGDHPYKLQFGAEMRPLYEWHIPRTMRGYLAVFLREAIREAKRVLKPLKDRWRSRRSTPAPSA
jgi:CelD/BcsL family acetyltransferase involved in cellulose biosynthesis